MSTTHFQTFEEPQGLHIRRQAHSITCMQCAGDQLCSVRSKLLTFQRKQAAALSCSTILRDTFSDGILDPAQTATSPNRCVSHQTPTLLPPHQISKRKRNQAQPPFRPPNLSTSLYGNSNTTNGSLRTSDDSENFSLDENLDIYHHTNSV